MSLMDTNPSWDLKKFRENNLASIGWRGIIRLRPIDRLDINSIDSQAHRGHVFFEVVSF